MKATNFASLILVLLINIACKDVEPKMEVDSKTIEPARPNTYNDLSKDSLDRLEHQALTQGDTMAYMYAASAHFQEGSDAEFLYTSLIMANKYHYSDAYYGVYTALAHSNLNDSYETLDDDTKFIALYYLLKAKEKGYENAINECERIFGKGKIPSSSSYLLKMAKK